jgi:hypothetical protein
MKKKAKKSLKVKQRKNPVSPPLNQKASINIAKLGLKISQNEQSILMVKLAKPIFRILSKGWKAITTIAVLFGLYVGYLNLKPNLIIEYAFNTIPPNQTALPIKITNASIRPVFVERADFIDSIKTVSKVFSYGNRLHLNVFQTIGPKKSIEKVCDYMNFHNPPQSGYYIIEVYYKVGIFHRRQGKVSAQFWIYKNRDGSIIWTNQQNRVPWPTSPI